MKRLAAALTGFAITVAALSGCDSTGPDTVTVHDTLRIYDTTYYNDRFAKANAVVHGIWKITTLTDTATATLFQDTTTILATVEWKSGAIWSMKSTKFTKDSLTLADGSNNFLYGRLTDSANHRIVKMSGIVFNSSAPSATLPAWTATRTF